MTRTSIGMMVLTAMLLACGGDEAAPPRSPEPPAQSHPVWTIGVAGDSGALDARTGRAALERRFGGALRDSAIHVGEGQTEPGTIVHPDDPARRVEIIWQDTARTRPARIQLRGDSSLWTLPRGITLGTRLAELEALNGAPFRLTGFGWDYGGTILGWNEGALEQILLGGNGRVLLRLAPPEGTTAPAGVAGDGVFGSELPELRALDPAVREIVVEYDVPAS